METPICFYVALAGNDDWSGTLAEVNAARSDGPFATLGRAREAIRACRSNDQAKRPITVYVRRGKHFLRAPLVLGPAESGTRTAPVTIGAYPGEEAILSGGHIVTGWQAYRGPIYRAELPGSKGGRWQFRQLFCNGQRMTRARWPKADPADPLYGGWAMTEDAAEPGSTTAFRFRPGAFRHHWAKPAEVEVLFWAGWGCWGSRAPLKRIDEEARTIELVHAGWQFDVPGWYQTIAFEPNNRYRVENALEDLDQPGEWCFDGEDGVLYFWPPDGTMAGCEVVVPALDCLIDLRGASWVNISGLTLTETQDGDNFHHEGVEGAGAMYPRPGWRYCGDAIHLKDAEHCCIEGNRFLTVGGNGVYLEGHNARNVVRRNEFAGAGANAVCLLGTRLKHPVFNQVTDNHIHHCGAINTYTAGIFSGMSDGNVISHNRLEYLPHHAINLSNSPNGRNLVEYNDIRFVDQAVDDSAAINCWMEEPPSRDAQRCGHVIRFNRIADVYGCEVNDGKVGPAQRFPISGIYLDNYTSNCFVYGNVIMRCTHAGILVHAGKNNVIENNIIVDCGASIRLQDYVSGNPFWQPMTGFMTGNHILRNISYQSNPRASLYHLYVWTEAAVAQAVGNVFFQVGDGKYALADVTGLPGGEKIDTLVRWRELGFDVDSLVADPLFVDPAHEDYRLRPESPAFGMGFVPIPVERIGIRGGAW